MTPAEACRRDEAALPLVDSHCHLDYLEREQEDLDQVTARARAAGVGTLLTICTRLSEFPTVLRIAERFERVFCSVGVHPHEADAEGLDAPARLVDASRHPKVVGIGETGLDYFYDRSDREAQRRSFRAHIAASQETGLPLIVHSRDADADTVEILGEEQARKPFPGVIHCFTAGPALAEAVLAFGFYISLAGIVTFKTAEALRSVTDTVPLERLLVETDSPFLAPVPMRGKRNEPSFVAHTAAFLAARRNMAPDAFARHTSDNFRRLFAKVSRFAP